MESTDAPAVAKAISGPARPRRLSEELARLQEHFAERDVRLEELIATLAGRAWLLLVILLALPFCLPLAPPGASTPLGLVIALIGARLAVRREPWLPRRLLATQLPAGFFGKLLGGARRAVRGLEYLLRPRLGWLTGAPVLRQVHALGIFIAAAVLLLPLPIPFSNFLPAWAILLLAGGLLERDGLFILAGHALLLLGLGYLAAIGLVGAHGLAHAWAWLQARL